MNRPEGEEKNRQIRQDWAGAKAYAQEGGRVVVSGFCSTVLLLSVIITTSF